MTSLVEVKGKESSFDFNTQRNGFQLLVFSLFVLHIVTLNSETNLYLFNFINGLSDFPPQWLLAIVTDLGHGSTLGTLVLCYLTLRPEMTVRVIGASILSLILVPLLKQYFEAPRPADVLDSLNIIGEVRHHLSFPSGHTATAFLFAGTIFLAVNCNKLKFMLIMLASLVGISRVMVGAHWPIDVVMGAILGLICAYTATKFIPLYSLKPKVRGLSYLILFLLLVGSEIGKVMDPDLLWQTLVLRWSVFIFCGALIVRYALANSELLFASTPIIPSSIKK